MCGFALLVNNILEVNMRNINVSYNDVKGNLNKYFNFCIGAGRAGELMRYIPIQQLKKAVKECGFRYIRFHGIFHEDMAVCLADAENNIIYNFQYTDMLFDSLLEIGIRPFLELSFMPKCLASGEQTLFFWNTNVTPPADYEKWNHFIRAFILHITERYGEEEIKQWYFEVWNEPNHPSFFSESNNIEAYYKLYKNTVSAVKSVNKNYRVGGPSSAGLAWFEQLAVYCKDNNVPIDFISGHNYCVSGHFDKDGKKILNLCDHQVLISPIKFYKELLEKYNLPMHITEWSSSFSSRDPIHDSYINAPFILETIKQLDGYTDSLSYWTYTDIFEEVSPPPTPFHGGFGLFNTQSIKKPSYYSYQFLNELGDTELKCDDKSVYATKSNNGAQILFWNYTQQNQGEADNKEFYSKLIPTKSISKTSVVITDLPCGTYTVTIKNVGYKKGDVYSEFLTGNYESLTSLEKTKQLYEASQPRIKQFSVSVNDGKFSLDFDSTENEIYLILLNKSHN